MTDLNTAGTPIVSNTPQVPSEPAGAAAQPALAPSAVDASSDATLVMPSKTAMPAVDQSNGQSPVNGHQSPSIDTPQPPRNNAEGATLIMSGRPPATLSSHEPIRMIAPEIAPVKPLAPRAESPFGAPADTSDGTYIAPHLINPLFDSRIAPLAPPHDSPFGGSSSASSLAVSDTLRIPAVPMSSSAQLQRVMTQMPVTPPQAVLEAQNLVKRFGSRTVVKGVHLQVGAGEIVGLLGRNGAGKTTTFRMIMGLLHPDSGTVNYQNRDITRLPMYMRANKGIGYLAQQPSIFQRMTVEDNLLAILEVQEPSRKKRLERVEELISSLGLGTVRKSMASVCSGGEQRRLEVARAMSLNPKIILFDEPFAGIDPITVTEIQGILRDLKSRGVGVLLTDHNVRETLTITDRTYIMDDGKIWVHGSPREIVQNQEVRARYLGHEFRFDF